MPHDCVDQIPVACEIVTALSAFVARQVAVTDPAVLSITKIAAVMMSLLSAIPALPVRLALGGPNLSGLEVRPIGRGSGT